MPFAQKAKLILAVSVVIVTIIILGRAAKPGAAAVPEPITRQILRRKDRSKLPASAAEIAELRRKAQEKEKRNLTAREFNDMPVKYKEIRNLDSETWYKDLQIEVKNIGTKPIYFMLAYLEFPDHKNPQGRDTGISLTFGDLKNWGVEALADPQDPHLDPGQTYIFTIPQKMAKGLAIQHERVPQQFKKLDFHIDIISFGDRTGFEIERPLDLRKQPNTVAPKGHHAKKTSSPTVRSPPQNGCGSCARYTTQGALTCFDLYTEEWCPPLPLIHEDSSKPCRLTRQTTYDCDGDGFEECSIDIVYNSEICPGYTPSASPTPTPTPTPEPTCDPATKPNNTNCSCGPNVIIGASPQWTCFCFYIDSSGLPHTGVGANYLLYPGYPSYGGCGPNQYNNGGDCCICTITSCPEGTVLNQQACECQAPSGGDDGGSTGGSGGDSPPVLDERACQDYYWVHFISTDGGQTWRYDDRETWAGCYYID